MDNPVPLQQNDLRRLQMVLLDMLTEIDRICRKHDIKYHLTGGTLLGAVRHKGFIPWDDDVDISMSRVEYEKFKKTCQGELDGSKFFLQDHTTDTNYRWGYAKLRRKDSELIRAGQEHMKMQTGIFVDIFITDIVPEFYPIRLIHALYCFVLRKILYSQTGVVTGKNAFARAFYKILNKVPAKSVFKRLERLAEFWNKRQAKFIRALTFPTPKHGSPAKWATDLIDIEFEGNMFLAMCDYNDYLRSKFGDYMTLPPEGKRHWHPASVLKLPDEYYDDE